LAQFHVFIEEGNMETGDTSRQPLVRPYRRLRDDPKFWELKKVIEDLPSDKIERLKNRLQELEDEC
jgi:hypothetical protein